MTTTLSAAQSARNVPLAFARVFAGLLGTVQLAGAVYFLFIAREEAVWVGIWLDVPLVALTLFSIFLKLGLAVLPGLPATRRVALGFLAVIVGVAVALLKISLYDEPEGVLFMVFDAVLLTLLAFAWRTAKRR